MKESSMNGPYVVMGVSGCGKSSVAAALASRTGGIFLDADDFHPEANKLKMAAGKPLTDEDRWGWLDTLNRELSGRAGDGVPIFLACSALRQIYRDRLSAGLPGLRFIYLKGSMDLIKARMQQRQNHFMPAALLESQFRTLEEPRDAIEISIANEVPVIVELILQQITKSPLTTYSMLTYKPLEKFSIGVGDRFAHQAKAQLRACQMIANDGVQIVPVWNKSNREHTFIGSEPASVYAAAKEAVERLGWTAGWHVDADHIGLKTVDRFIECSDFFTLDVAESIGHPAAPEAVKAFVDRHPELVGTITIPKIDSPFETDRGEIERIAGKFLLAVQEAGRIYRHIAERKGAGNFIAEVSMDETDSPQTPPELLVILAAIADEGIPAQTIAPKFTGRFNKGVDYVGDLAQFEKEFQDDLAVIAFAVGRYGLPGTLKLSVHSGSDKFSLYPIIRRGLPKFNAGLHLKTAGTTWLEEIIGLAEAGGEGLSLAKEIYGYAIGHRAKLPTAKEVNAWTSEQFTGALRHDQAHPLFNPSLRQLLHVSFKLAAKEGPRYLGLLEANEEIVGRNVTENLYARHLRPLFIGD
jgi:carbohydrate kinase (thermoresistant glucokinase family)